MSDVICWTMLLWALQVPPDSAPEVLAAELPLANSVRAELRLESECVPVGSPVVVEFVIQNLTGEPVSLAVPGAPRAKEQPDYDGMGLPLEHVFSGVKFRGLEIAAEENPRMGDRVTRRPLKPVPPLTLAPFGTIGLRFDIARFYPGLHQAGLYELSWKPYAGALAAKPLMLEVISYKQAVIETDYGTMTMHFLYDKAPRHVANFIELTEDKYYNGKSFTTVYPGQFALGGCPAGDLSAKRPDGQCIEAEFNDVPFEAGVVGMALIEGDESSGSCQFFICLADQPGWKGRYTAFGRIQGPQSLAVLRKLGAVAVDENHQPLKPLKIKRITITPAILVPRAFQ
ncbi:MAG: peptidylprolyl isomerase [Planctomycetota bacterium]|nr:peptidylprolyl isomerase [Planctomycetota bacterium]